MKQMNVKHDLYGLLVADHVHTRKDGAEVYLFQTGPYREFDASNCNDYAVSDVREWLNSDKPAGKWWTEKHGEGSKKPSYWDVAGFLAGFDKEFLDKLEETEFGYFFLPSYTEITGMPNGRFGMDGEQFDAFEGGKNRAALCKCELFNGGRDWWWLRSANPGISYSVRGVSASGDTDAGYSAFYRRRLLVPAFVIKNQ